ncbi:MAG: energy transducer TonB [Mailhella sp.]|nr:energy transducer TonB [Mailhella sp.]
MSVFIRRAPSLAVSVAAGAFFSMFLLSLLILSSMGSGVLPELSSGTPGIRISDVSPSQQQEVVQQTPMASPSPDMPVMRITPNMDVAMDTPEIKVEYAVNPNINIGISVPTPPSFTASAPAAPAYLSAGELDNQPRLTHSPFPNYPPEARRAKREGQVMVRIVIDTGGRVINARILPGPDTEIFGETTLKAVKRWRFRPGEKLGQKVACEVEIPVVFKLDR